MALSIRDYTIIKVVQASHHQGDIRYGESRGIQCSCMSFMSVSWILFKSPGICDKFELDSILTRGDQLSKFIGKFRYLRVEDLPQEFLLKNYSMNVKFLENKTGEITAGAYLFSIAEIVNCAQGIGTGALIIVDNYILGLTWGNDYIYLFDSRSKDQYGKIPSSGTTVLLKFYTLFSLENYIKSVYYNTYPLMLYFQVQFMKAHCTENAKDAVKSLLKKE